MFCYNCGQENLDDSAFCTSCGASLCTTQNADQPVAAQATMQTPTTQTPNEQQELPYQPTIQADSTQPSLKTTQKKKMIIGLIAAALLVAGIVAGIFVWLNVQKAQETFAINTEIVFSNANIDETSGVPLRIEGYDLNNNEVSEDILLTAADESINLSRGHYTITILGTPVSNSGYLYTIATTEIPVEIVDDHASIDDLNYDQLPGHNSDSKLELPLDFSAIPANEVTDEMLDEARQWMSQFGFEQDVIDAYIDSAIKTRKTELARIAEEEARAKAEALRKAAFGSFPARFSFSSGAGAWGSVMDIKPDGSFTESFHDVDAGDSGPGYSGTTYLGEFAGSFTVVEQVNSTTFKLQLNELRSTHKDGEFIDSEGMRNIYSSSYANIGKVTSSPVKGYTLYLPGSRKSDIGIFMQSWLNDGPATIDYMVIVDPSGGTWVTAD